MQTQATDLLAGVQEAASALILDLGAVRTYREGETVFSLGSQANELFLVKKGRVRLTLPVESSLGQEDVFLEERVPGQLLGWSALVPPFRFTLKGAATEETLLLSIPGSDLLNFLDRHPEVGHAVMSNLARIIGQRLQMFQTMWVREIQRMVRMTAPRTAGEPSDEAS